MDLKDLENLIRFVSKVGVSEVKYKTKDYKITIRTNSYIVNSNLSRSSSLINQESTSNLISPINTNDSNIPIKNQDKNEVSIDETKYLTIKSPMIGTFYEKSGPEKPPFVKKGDFISTGTVLCIIEAMKLFNEIESEVSGKIIKILVEDSTPVEYDQPLFLVSPS